MICFLLLSYSPHAVCVCVCVLFSGPCSTTSYQLSNAFFLIQFAERFWKKGRERVSEKNIAKRKSAYKGPAISDVFLFYFVSLRNRFFSTHFRSLSGFCQLRYDTEHGKCALKSRKKNKFIVNSSVITNWMDPSPLQIQTTKTWILPMIYLSRVQNSPFTILLIAFRMIVTKYVRAFFRTLRSGGKVRKRLTAGKNLAEN